jgi:hypothetical protein
MSTSTGPILQANGMYYVTYTSSANVFYERWFHTYTMAVRWLQEITEDYP